MFIEKKLKSVSPRLLAANGTPNGLVTLNDTRGFYVGQYVAIVSDTQPSIRVKIKRFESLTSFYVGPADGKITERTNISAYLLADNAKISADEQDRPGISVADRERAVFVEEPVVANRAILVDEHGNYYNADNPLPATAIIEGDVFVDLDGFDNLNPDSVQITGSEDGTKTGTKFGVVNNRRLQILAAKDRQQSLTYADFGTKDQRIVQIDYTAPSIGTGVGFTARKTFVYVLVGNRYRRDDIIWSLI